MSPSPSPVPELSRRALVTAVLATGLLGAAGGRALVGAGRNMLALVRPPASGTSTTRCGLCGSTDHAMLSSACPASPRGLAS